MKFTKKVKAILCTVIILATSLHPAWIFAEQSNMTADDNGKIIQALGIFSEDKKYSHILTRAEFIKMVCEFVGLYNVSGYVSYFNDVPKSHPYYNYISVAATKGWVAKGGTFYPLSEISFDEAKTILKCSLGYSGDMSKYYAAIDSKLVSGVKNTGKTLDYGTALKLFFNASAINVFGTVKFDDGLTKVEKSNKNALEEYHDIYTAEGRITATDKSALSVGEKPSPLGMVRINDIDYRVADTNADELLGYSVKYYYVDNKIDDELDLVYISINDKYIITVDSEDIDINSGRQSLIYEVKDRVKTVKIASDADLLYNGIAQSFNADWKIRPLDGSVTVIDSDGDGRYDIVMTTSYITYYVASKNAAKQTIYDKYIQPVLDLSNVIYKIFRDGKEIQMDDIVVNTALSIKSDAEYIGENGLRYIDNENCTYIEITASTNMINGVVTSINKDTVYLGKNSYKYSGYLQTLIERKKISQIISGNAVSLVIDDKGKIAAYDNNAFNTKKYGILIRAFIDDADEETLYVKLKNTDSQIETIKCSKSVKIDNVKYKNKEDAKNHLAEFDPDTQTYVMKAQVIGYTANVNGEINIIDTIKEDEGGNKENSLTCDMSGNFNWRDKRTFAGAMALSSDTTLFIMPESRIGDDKEFDIQTVSYFKTNNYYTVDGLSVRDGLCNKVIVYDKPGSVTLDENSNLFIVKNVKYILNEDDEAILQVQGMHNRNEVTYEIDVNAELVEYSDTDNKVYFTVDDLHKGDVFFFSVNTKGKINKIERMVDFSKADTCFKWNGFMAVWGLRYGKVYSENQGVVQLAYSGADLSSASNLEIFNVGALDYVYLFDAKSKTVSLGSVNDIIAYKNSKNASNCSYVFTRMKYGSLMEAVIYNF